MRLHAIVEDLATARAAVDAGATVVQLRRKEASTEELVELGEGFGELAATFVVNDDVEAAVRLGADGVHLGRQDAGADRAVAAGLVLGTSAARVEEARGGEAQGASYIGAGPVWETPSKPDANPAIGLEGLAEICRAVSVTCCRSLSAPVVIVPYTTRSAARPASAAVIRARRYPSP